MTAPPTNNYRQHRRKSCSSTNKTRSRQNSSVDVNKEEDDSPAFQSLVDIIREMKRLPSVSITTDKQDNTSTEEKENNNNTWKRVRRHSEPPHELQKKNINDQLNVIHGRPIFSNSFLALEEEEGVDCENNNNLLVSPLNNELEVPTKRTRSKSG
jgi:hypothetical protein